jgi:SagB-type dehydrogenase family enzyme
MNNDSPHIRIRRARCLVAFWDENEFVLQNYLTDKQTRVAPLVVHLLEDVQNYLPEEAVIEHFGSIPSARQLIEQLLAQDIFVIQGSALDAKECLIEQIWNWKQEARFFHYGTQHVPWGHDFESEFESLARLASEVPPPAPFKDYGGSRVKLSGSFEERAGQFWEVLRQRRTRRQFLKRALSLDDFSTLVLWTWGQTHAITDPGIGQYILKTSPSGGARHPMEVYPVVLNVEGIDPGIYHYSVKHHALEHIGGAIAEDHLVYLCGNQEWVRDAAVVFFMTAVVARSMWKYKQSHAYRVLLLDAGHVGQTFQLVCTQLGLAPFTTAATRDTAIEQELGLDGVSEIAIYTAAAGIPLHPSPQIIQEVS